MPDMRPPAFQAPIFWFLDIISGWFVRFPDHLTFAYLGHTAISVLHPTPVVRMSLRGQVMQTDAIAAGSACVLERILRAFALALRDFRRGTDAGCYRPAKFDGACWM